MTEDNTKRVLKKKSHNHIYLNNTKLTLKCIKKTGQISRSEIAKQTKLTPPTIAKIIDELVTTYKLVEYVGLGASSGGRPPVVVRFREENNYIIGIDLGATYIRASLVDMGANFVSEVQIPTELEKGFNHVIGKVIRLIKKFIQRQSDTVKIWGVGIGVAGLINRKTGMIETSPDFGWSKINLHEELRKEIDLPIFYNNSTRLMALGELNFGNHENLDNFAIINLGYGIAAGIVSEGNLINGHSGFAGEFGHIPIEARSKIKCKCGMNGCLEALASGNRIAELGIELLKNNKSEILHALCDGNQKLVSAELVAKAAIQGDKACIEIYDNICEYLAIGIGTLSNLLNPEIVFLGGGISLNGKFFFDLINSKVSRYLLEPSSILKISPSTFGEQATCIGAVSLVLEKVMNLEL